MIDKLNVFSLKHYQLNSIHFFFKRAERSNPKFPNQLQVPEITIVRLTLFLLLRSLSCRPTWELEEGNQYFLLAVNSTVL